MLRDQAMNAYDALITDGDLRLTLVVLRSLARKNIEAVVGAESKRALSFFSKSCKRMLLYPSPKDNSTEFLIAVQNTLHRTKFRVLFPIGEWTIFPISKIRDRIPRRTKLPLPPHETLEKTLDKELTFRLAIKDGIPTPETYFVRSLRELKAISEKVKYPAVIKPRWSWVWNRGKALFRRPSYVNSAGELLSVYEVIHRDFPFPLIQEYIPGTNYSVATLYCNSQLKAICGIKVYRAMPVTGGNSVYRESVELDPAMKKYALQLLEALDWYGIAEIEFRVDSRDHIPKLMEINGRFWGSLEVAVAAGVDFPYLLYCLATDSEVRPVLSYRKGVKCRWFGGDVQHLLSVLKGVSNGASLQWPSRLRTLIDFLKFYEKGLMYDSLCCDDPMPFFSSIYAITSERALFTGKIKKFEF